MHIAVIDIGKPGKNLGWWISGEQSAGGDDVDDCIKRLAAILKDDGLALGFEAPLFVPARENPSTLLQARQGECGTGLPSRPFSAGAGPMALVAGLVVITYVLSKLRASAPTASATLDWRGPSLEANQLLFFEALVTNQKNTAASRHVQDAKLAADAFCRGVADRNTFESCVSEPDCMSLIGAMMLRTGWTRNLDVLQKSCLVVRG